MSVCPEQHLQSSPSAFGQNFIRPQLVTVPGAANPWPYGGMVRQIQTDLDQHALQARGLSAQDVVGALAEQNGLCPVPATILEHVDSHDGCIWPKTDRPL